MNNLKTSNAEAAEPSFGTGSTPVWLFGLLALLLYWGMQYLDLHGGGFTPVVYEPYASSAMVKSIQPRTNTDPAIEDGEKVYKASCILCHQPNGMGTPGQFPPLAGSEWVLAPSPNRIARIVLHGVAGPIEVKGTPLNGAMPPWKDVFTDAQIAHVLTYIRSNWGNNASKVTPAQVTAIREAEKNRATPWSSPELLAVPLN